MAVAYTSLLWGEIISEGQRKAPPQTQRKSRSSFIDPALPVPDLTVHLCDPVCEKVSLSHMKLPTRSQFLFIYFPQQVGNRGPTHRLCLYREGG